MAKKFLIFTSVGTIIFSILACLILPFALEDVATAALSYYDQVRAVTEPFSYPAESGDVVYISSRQDKLTVKKSTDSNVHISQEYVGLNDVRFTADKVDNTISFYRIYNQRTRDVFRRENIMKLICAAVYDTETHLTIYVPEDVRVVFPLSEPWFVEIEEGIDVKFNQRDYYDNNVWSPELPTTPDFETDSSYPDPYSSNPTQSNIYLTIDEQDYRRKLREIDNGYDKLYDAFEKGMTEQQALVTQLDAYFPSELEMLDLLLEDREDKDYIKEVATSYALLVQNININQANAERLEDQYEAGLIDKPTYYAQDLELLSQRQELLSERTNYNELTQALYDIKMKYGFEFPFADTDN